jgi:plasmid maintenance system antidote protein VapI
MDFRKATRLQNLLKLLDKSGMPQKDFAAAVGASEKYLSQLVSDGRRGVGRKIGDPTAKKIETRFGLPEGWMDVRHDASIDLPANAAGSGRYENSLDASEPTSADEMRLHLLTLIDVLASSTPGLAEKLLLRAEISGTNSQPRGFSALVVNILRAAVAAHAAGPTSQQP